jgi:prolyl oligopeptidase
MRTTVVLPTLVAVIPALAAPPPPTRVEPVKETIHGVELVDPYRWLEGDNSDPAKMGAITDEVARWTDAQNAHTRSILDKLPGRARIEEQLRPLMQIGSVSAPRMVGNRYFYTRREGAQNQPVVYWREGYRGQPRVLIDPERIDPSGLTTVAFFAPCEAGELVAFGIYRAGDENTTAYVLNVQTGEWLADEIPGKVGGVQWMPDSSGFFYRNLRDVADPYSAQFMFHRLGSWRGHDLQLFRQFTRDENKDLATTWGPFGGISRDARWVYKGYYTSTKANDLWFADLQQWFRTGRLDWIDVMVGRDARATPHIVGNTMFLETDADAPNGTVWAIDLLNPAREHWKNVVPHRPDAVISDLGIAKGILAVEYMINATSRIELFAFDGSPLGTLRLPQEVGSAGLSTREDRTEAFLTFTSFNYPTTIFRVDLARPDAEPELWERPDVPVDPTTIHVTQEWFSSRDGTRVPMFIVHRKGLRLDGSNPTILTGYGGFNIPMTPGFSATNFPWYEAGGVFALPNLRGGGEFGETWHRSGMLESKQNVFDDFIAAAEFLIQKGYTNPNRLAISGGSNGGLLIGAAVTQRPELFRAAHCAVPLLDMLRYQHFLMARYWVPEYGSAEDPAQFQYLLKYSPYHQIKPGVRYPAILFTTGENDTRVHPMHARKMAAALQAATGASPDERPILLWVDREAGHGAGKPLNLRIRDAADVRAFFMWQLGMLRD